MLDDDTIICECLNKTYKELKEAKDSGSYTLDALVFTTEAGTACGQCKSLEEDKSFRRNYHLKEDILS